ncbi:hypothetical protein MKZ38_006713 [Zalerion maritima]|uniref:ATPase AAA-type core domain-containing protein n=1 Tax=Zalerion maritima TaxID=339359 RepID=A0AAD5RJT5_9PEZI|nr:hypothetical protein MKZ38_006713 [Zalerion maritima]
MESDNTSSETGRSTFDSIPGDQVETPPTPSLQDDKNEVSSDRHESQAGTPIANNHKPGTTDTFQFADEIQTLKQKLLELERQTKAEPVLPHSDQPVEEAPQPGLVDEVEQYKLMEDCLYRHRKEWESNREPGRWFLAPYLDFKHDRTNRLGRVDWKLEYLDPPYERPNLFDLSTQFPENTKNTGPYDDFDRTIDFGNRRERIRKTFEWEMDRLYFVEETESRKQKKAKEAEERQQRDFKAVKARKRVQAGMQPMEDDSAPSSPTFAIPRLNRVDWQKFKLLGDLAEKDASVVNILVGEPETDETNGYRSWFGYQTRRVQKVEKSQDHKTLVSANPGIAQLPERIRIHSSSLLQILSKILGSGGSSIDDCETAVFIRPFKALTHCQQALREWCTKLHQKFDTSTDTEENSTEKHTEERTPASDDTSAASGLKKQDCGGDEESSRTPANNGTTDENKSTDHPKQRAEQGEENEKQEDSAIQETGAKEGKEDDPNDITKSSTALEHLECLLSFIDSEIAARQAHFGDVKCRKVYFSDLWQFFRPGMEVTGSDGKQAYRIINVTSAKHRVAPPWAKFYQPPSQKGFKLGKKPKAPFSIVCVYVDFDGKNLGPVLKRFDFKRFEGEREITSLEVYPLQFHPIKQSDFSELDWKRIESFPEKDKYRQWLIYRGAKFLDVAAPKHMYYDGPTIELRDETESQVVIDFETAFSVEDKVQQDWQPELKILVGGLPSEEHEQEEDKTPCRGPCCLAEAAHDDTYVDQKQSAEYIESLLPKPGASNEQPPVTIFPRPLKELQPKSGGISGISEEELVIMSYRVFGFVLRSRKWAKLDLAYLTDVPVPDEPSEEEEGVDPGEGREGKRQPAMAFNRLVLEDGHKPMIVSLITQHFRDKEARSSYGDQVDIVKGKGTTLPPRKGTYTAAPRRPWSRENFDSWYVLLLPFASNQSQSRKKSRRAINLISQAEGVAEMFKKPLFQITCGDLGTTAREVEKALETNFTLANRWDCILLLDEADVFLAARTKEDFKRNGLVAAFLRVMEYYAGILFLTTNRIGDFDEAFRSRIHISLYYPELSNSKTVEVFKINMDMIAERFIRRGRRIKIDEAGIAVFASQHFDNHPQGRWNGRQVRNACQTALALAEFEAQGNSHTAILKPDAVVNLGVKHFETVRKAYLDFTKYLHDLYNTDDAQRAKDHGLRAVWINEQDGTITSRATNKRAAFRMALQPQPPSQIPQQQPPMPLGFQAQAPRQEQYGFQQQPQQWQHQQHQHYQHQNMAAPQPVYQNQAQGQPQMEMQAQQFTNNPAWGAQGTPVGTSPFQGSGEAQGQIPRSQPPASSQPLQPSLQQQAFLGQNIPALYEPCDQHRAGNVPPSNLPSAAGEGSYPPTSNPPFANQQPPGY